jgi:hypothetical protein
MHDTEMTPPDGSYRDRRLGLVIFGAMEILIGLALLALVILSVIAAIIAPSMADLGVLLPSLVLYAVLALAFIGLGIGSIRARKWARELSLSLAWVWLITGVLTMILTWLFVPGLWRELAVGSGLSISAAQAVNVGMNVFLSFIYVLLPGGFVVFYRSPDVAATCRARDTSSGWTGRCPQRLLALSVAYALLGLSVLTMPSYNWVFPLFGRLLVGTSGASCWVAVFVVCMALAWGIHRGRPWAWWAAMATSAAAFVTTAVTFASVTPDALFAAMGPMAGQLEIFKPLWPSSPWTHVLIWLAVWGSLIGYLLVVRKLFDPPLGRGRDAT